MPSVFRRLRSTGITVGMRITIKKVVVKGRVPGARLAVRWSKGKHKGTTTVGTVDENGVYRIDECLEFNTTLIERKKKQLGFTLMEAVRNGNNEEKLVGIFEQKLDVCALYFEELAASLQQIPMDLNSGNTQSSSRGSTPPPTLATKEVVLQKDGVPVSICLTVQVIDSVILKSKPSQTPLTEPLSIPNCVESEQWLSDDTKQYRHRSRSPTVAQGRSRPMISSSSDSSMNGIRSRSRSPPPIVVASPTKRIGNSTSAIVNTETSSHSTPPAQSVSPVMSVIPPSPPVEAKRNNEYYPVKILSTKGDWIEVRWNDQTISCIHRTDVRKRERPVLAEMSAAEEMPTVILCGRPKESTDVGVDHSYVEEPDDEHVVGFEGNEGSELDIRCSESSTVPPDSLSIHPNPFSGIGGNSYSQQLPSRQRWNDVMQSDLSTAPIVNLNESMFASRPSWRTLKSTPPTQPADMPTSVGLSSRSSSFSITQLGSGRAPYRSN